MESLASRLGAERAERRGSFAIFWVGGPAPPLPLQPPRRYDRTSGSRLFARYRLVYVNPRAKRFGVLR